jgi:hypothetical protein
MHPDHLLLHAAARSYDVQRSADARRGLRSLRPRPPGRLRRGIAALLLRLAVLLDDEPQLAMPRRA